MNLDYATPPPFSLTLSKPLSLSLSQSLSFLFNFSPSISHLFQNLITSCSSCGVKYHFYSIKFSNKICSYLL